MPDEFAVQVATALATKGAEALVAVGRSALKSLVSLVRDRFGRHSGEAAVLRKAMDHPDMSELHIELAEVLNRMMRADPVFRGRVQAYWREAATELSSKRNNSVANHFSGTAQKVVQARDVHGDLTM
jgi:hypothetical protein